jgi:hypothetical protein
MTKTSEYKWYDYLPHGIRRGYYRHFLPQDYLNLVSMRQRRPSSDYSLEGFDKNKCIFVHIPKCAGVSINRALFGNLGGGHHSAMDYQIIYQRSIFNNYYKFTFVRNPWDRIFSAYNFLKKGGFNEGDKIWAEKNLDTYDTFDKFVCEWVNKKNIHTKNHFVPQYHYICNASGKIMVDYIGRFETINKDYEHILEKIGLKNEIKHENKTSNQKKMACYTEYYTENTKKIIADVYEKDINLLGYEYTKTLKY